MSQFLGMDIYELRSRLNKGYRWVILKEIDRLGDRQRNRYVVDA
jgi:hypothetical protein